MIITILNGNPGESALDARLAEVRSALAGRGARVTQIDLRTQPIRDCTGCWDCWVKTPGECSHDEASQAMGRAVMNCDFLLWAAPLKMGYPAALLKTAMDKHLPLIHPYIEVDQGEAHHRRRYTRYPRLGLLVEPEADTDDRDLRIVTQLFSRTALNFKTRLEFCRTTQAPGAEIADWMLDPHSRRLRLPGRLSPTLGTAIHPPARLTLFNGSPRGPSANSAIFLSEFAQGFGRQTRMVHLVQAQLTPQHLQAFAEAECACLGFPLYTDAMPGMVKRFIEALEPVKGRKNNPPLGFIVQSGFPEALHSRYIERYLEKLAGRLGCPYLGTIVKGGGEGVRHGSASENRPLFEGLHALGEGLAREGRLDAKILARLALPERYPAYLGPVFQLFLRLPMAHAPFDDRLKKNGAYERRFARPFVD